MNRDFPGLIFHETITINMTYSYTKTNPNVICTLNGTKMLLFSQPKRFFLCEYCLFYFSLQNLYTTELTSYC